MCCWTVMMGRSMWPFQLSKRSLRSCPLVPPAYRYRSSVDNLLWMNANGRRPERFPMDGLVCARLVFVIAAHSLGVMPRYYLISLVMVIGVLRSAPAAERVLTPKLHHLRSGAVREWADFPEQADAADVRLSFAAKANPAQQTLRLRHRDVK